MFQLKNALLISMFLVIFFTDYLTAKLHILPGVFSYFPDVFAISLAVFVVPRIIARKSFKIPIKYLLLFFAFVYVVLSGIVLNEISIETIVAGARIYFKYVFIFLLPLAYDYTIADLKIQFKVLVLLGLLQIPVSFLQRFVFYADMVTGDVISGTLSLSTTLTIMMVGLIIILLALYLKKIISIKTTLLLAFLLFLPTAINETKATAILLPAGLAGLFFTMYKEISKKQITVIIGSGVVLIGLYVTLYNTLYSSSQMGVGYVEMMTGEQGMARTGGYNFSGFQADPNAIADIDEKIVGAQKDLPQEKLGVGRFDTFVIPLQLYFGDDSKITQSLFGFGIGNATSEFGKGGVYKHIRRVGGGQTSLSLFLWETGLIGTFIFIVFLMLISWDAYWLAKESGVWGGVASGWFGIMLITIATLPYYTMFYFPEITFLFMYFSGVVAINKSVDATDYLHS